MALITDPDDLVEGVSIVYDFAASTIRLIEAGNLSSDGVTLKALYSHAKDSWTDVAGRTQYLFPWDPTTTQQYDMINGWDFYDDATRYLIRSGGWSVRNSLGNVTQTWPCIRSLGEIGASDQIYFDLGQGAVDFQLAGAVNQPIQVLSDPNGDGTYSDGFDRRAFFKMYVRQRGKTFASSDLLAIGETAMSNALFTFAVGNGVDSKITATDADIATNAPYTGMSITYHASAQSRTIGSGTHDFGVVIDGNGGSAEQIYEFVQYKLRQSSDIDDGPGSVVGVLADSLLAFTGDSLSTLQVTNPSGGGSGVYIDNFSAADTNRITFIDNSGGERSFPFVAAVVLQFNETLVADPAAQYWVYFTDANGNQFGTAGALLLDDASGADVAGSINGNATASFTFDYDGNVQGGRAAGTDAAITVVATGRAVAQHVVQTGLITRSTANVVSLVARVERVYSNAA